MAQILDSWPIVEKILGVSTAVLCAAVFLFLVVYIAIYGVKKIIPYLQDMNHLIANNTKVTEAACQAITAQSNILQDMKTSIAVHDQRTSQLQTEVSGISHEVSGIGHKVDRLEHNVNQINNRLDSVSTTVGIICGKVD